MVTPDPFSFIVITITIIIIKRIKIAD